jgi:hypothetical protein
VRFRARSSSRESVGEGRGRYIKRVSTLSDRGIFAITVGYNSSSKVFFRVGRHTKEKRKSVASKSIDNAKSTRGDVRLPGVSDFGVDDVIRNTWRRLLTIMLASRIFALTSLDILVEGWRMV